MAITKVSDLSSLYANIYEDSLFVARERNLMTSLVTPYSATGFMTRSISTWPTVTATAKSEGIDFTAPTTFSKTSAATLTPSVVFAQSILTDEAESTSQDDIRRAAAQELGGAIATKIDVDLCADFTSFTTDKGPGAGGTATIGKFSAAISVLRHNNVGDPLYAVVHPYTWHDIWVELGQPAANYPLLGEVANEALRSYFVGRWVNVVWFTNANIAADASDDAISAVFSPQSMAFDSRMAPRMEVERDASRLATELNMSAAYAHGVIRATYGVKYTADVTEPS